MKNMILILSVLFFFTGCNEEETKQEQQENSIYGTWQLVEFFSHPPTGNGWSQVENGFKITIKTNNSFSSNEFSDCETGNIILTSNQISLVYECGRFTEKSYSYEFVENKLELTPRNYLCYEGCNYRLTKITTEE